MQPGKRVKRQTRKSDVINDSKPSERALLFPCCATEAHFLLIPVAQFIL